MNTGTLQSSYGVLVKGRSHLLPVSSAEHTILVGNFNNTTEDDNNRKKVIKLRDELSKRMTSSQVARAQDVANECREKNYLGCDKSENKIGPNKENPSLEAIENKCTELGFAKGTEKHGDCVMKISNIF